LRVGHISLSGATVGDQWEHEAVRRAVEESGAEYLPDSDEAVVIGGGGSCTTGGACGTSRWRTDGLRG
jgi:hypothetical protein